MATRTETPLIPFLLCSDPDNLAAALKGRSATVEAEYGDRVVEGSVLTMAHHGPRAGYQAPCSYLNEDVPHDLDTVGLSHVDLDSVAGCLALIGRKPECPGFWKLAEFVDLNGAHKLSQSGASDENIRRLWAWWAWSETRPQYAPRDGSVTDVTEFIYQSMGTLMHILEADYRPRGADPLKDGDEHRAAEQKLNEGSFIENLGGVVVRVAPTFVNHLYVMPDGTIGDTVVALNPQDGSITVSFADEPKGTNAREIVQKLWGDEAGGHPGIAGSPRNRRMKLADLLEAVGEVALVLAQ